MRQLGLLLLIPFSLALAVCLLGPSLRFDDSRTTNTHSHDLPDDAAKVRFLRRYVHPTCEIEAAEYHIWYQDNSGFVSGPSDWEMKIVMKVPKEQLPLYTENLDRTVTADLSWGYALLPVAPRWGIQSHPVIYSRGSKIVAIFEAEGIVFEYNSTIR